MANSDRDCNGSQFFITFKASPHLDGKHVVFGKLISGHETLKKIEHVEVDGEKPTIPVKIANSGELIDHNNRTRALDNEKKKVAKSKSGYHAPSVVDSLKRRLKGHQKNLSKGRRKKKRRSYYLSESDSSSSETDSESSETDSDSDSYSSTSDKSSSTDDWRRKRKRYSRRKRRLPGKSKRNRRREKKRRERRRRHRRIRTLESDTETESTNESRSGNDGVDYNGLPQKAKVSSQISGKRQPSDSLLLMERDAGNWLKKGVTKETIAGEDGKSSKQHGEVWSNGFAENKFDRNADRPPNIVGNCSTFRGCIRSPDQSKTKNASMKPRTASREPLQQNSDSLSRSPETRHVRSPAKSRSSGPARKSFSSSPAKSRGTSPGRKAYSRSPATRIMKSTSKSPVNAYPRSISKSSAESLPHESVSRSLVNSPPIISRNHATDEQRSISRISVRSLSRRSPSSSPTSSLRRSISRSPVRSSSSRSPVRRSISRSPVRNNRKDYNRSPVPARRSIRQRYRTPTPDRSPVRSYRYNGRHDRERYSRYRSYRERSPLRRHRSPPRKRQNSYKVSE